MSDERRKDYQEMHDDIKEIKRILVSEQGLCVRMGQAETKLMSIQTELTEHKQEIMLEKRVDRLDTRFWYLIGGFICSVIAFIFDVRTK